MTFGDWIDSQRLTYREVAKRTGISHPTIARYATGSRNPTLESFRILCERLGIPEGVKIELAKQWGGLHLKEFERWQAAVHHDLGE